MASIEKRISKSGERTYHITVCAGYGLDGKKVRRRTTYKPDANMSDKQADKAAQKEAFRFDLIAAQPRVLCHKAGVGDFARRFADGGDDVSFACCFVFVGDGVEHRAVVGYA